jgi:malonyl CoA-acyl carrier protein transacylase
MEPTAILFPGQGSLTADAGPQARDRWPELVDRACALVGADPFERAADSTRFAQPAIFVASMAAWRERQDELADADAMAGHSLGELSALAAAGALRVEDALALVVLRGSLMGGAADARPGGGMVALLGTTPDEAAELAERHDLQVANDNAPGQVVVSGDAPGLRSFTADAREQGLKAMELDVTGAFHSRAMAVAEQPFRRALEQVRITAPRVPVVSGCTASPFTDIPVELARALAAPVRWRETMAALARLGASRFVDIGPGAILARLVKRNAKEWEGHVVAA